MSPRRFVTIHENVASVSSRFAMGGKAYFLSALAVAALSGGGYYTYHHGRLPDWYWEAKIPDNIEVLDVTDTAKLKHVLFSGEPWLLQCYSGLPYEGQWLPRPFRVHRVFQESLGSLAGLVKAGILDCEKRLPSNKSLVEKFGFVRRSQPLLVLAAGGVKPRQLPANSVSSAYGVTAFVKPKAESKVHKVGTQKTLEAVCGGRRPCLLTRMKPDSVVLEQLARTFRTVEVVTLGENLAKARLELGATLASTPALTLASASPVLALTLISTSLTVALTFSLTSFPPGQAELGPRRGGGRDTRGGRGAALRTAVRLLTLTLAPATLALTTHPHPHPHHAPSPLTAHRSPLTAHLSPSPSPQPSERRVSFLKYDSEAPKGRKGSMPPRLLRGFGGDEDLPSLSRFVTASLAATEGFMATEFPKVSAPVKPKKAVRRRIGLEPRTN